MGIESCIQTPNTAGMPLSARAHSKVFAEECYESLGFANRTDFVSMVLLGPLAAQCSFAMPLRPLASETCAKLIVDICVLSRPSRTMCVLIRCEGLPSQGSWQDRDVLLVSPFGELVATARAGARVPDKTVDLLPAGSSAISRLRELLA